MPLFLLAPEFLIPLVAGAVGLFGGSLADHAVSNVTSSPTSGFKIPWQVSLVIILIVAVIVYFAVKKFFK